MTEAATARKVLICTPCYVLHGGVERIIEALAALLPRHGFRVVVGLARGERFHLPDRFRREYPTLDCVEIDGRSGQRAGRLRGLRGALRQVRPDIVLIARLYDAYEAVWERKAAGDPVRLAVTVQAYEADYITDLADYASCVDVCVTSGRLVAKAIQHFTRLPAERVRSIPGGVRPAQRLVQHEDTAPLRLGYVGRLEQPQKRILDLAETLSTLVHCDVPFTCRVTGTGPAEAELRQTLRERGLDKRVSFDGWRSSEELYGEVYPALDVLLHFAAWEGITIAPREAMAHGVVPVMSQFLGCRTEGQFRAEENALTFAVGDAEQAAACVARLHSDRALLQRLSEQARHSQNGVNSEEGAAAAWAEAFTFALEQPPRVASPTSPPFPPSGRLERWGIPVGLSEQVRRLFGVKFRHNGPGGEWPHSSGLHDSARLREIADFAAVQESQLSHAETVRG